jgi:hypothetical protein
VRIFLSILDFVIVFVVVISLARSVWRGQSGKFWSLVLAACVTLAFAIFGLISLLAASGLTTKSPFDQGALLIFLIGMAIATGMSWGKKPVQ